MASPVETMESCCSEAAFQPARNPKKRQRGSSDTGPVSPRGERSSETPIETSIVTIKPVNAKQSMKKVIVNGLVVARELDRIAGGSVAKVSSRANANYIVVTAHNNKQAKSMTSHTKFGGIDVAITLGKPSFSIKGVIMGIPHDIEDKDIFGALQIKPRHYSRKKNFKKSRWPNTKDHRYSAHFLYQNAGDNTLRL